MVDKRGSSEDEGEEQKINDGSNLLAVPNNKANFGTSQLDMGDSDSDSDEGQIGDNSFHNTPRKERLSEAQGSIKKV